MTENEVKLPELPEPTMRELNPYLGSGIDPYNGAESLTWYTADQLRAYAAEAVRMNQAAGGEAVADVEDVLRRARRIARKINDDMLGDDYLNLSADLLELLEKALSPRTGLSIFRTAPPAAQVQQEAIGYIDRTDEETFVELYPDRHLPTGAKVYLHPETTHPAADALGAVRGLAAHWFRQSRDETLTVSERANYLGFAGMLQAALAQQPAGVDEAWRQKAAEWLEAKAVEQEANNQRWPDHAAAYKEWRDRPGVLRYLAAQVLALEAALGQGKANG